VTGKGDEKGVAGKPQFLSASGSVQGKETLGIGRIGKHKGPSLRNPIVFYTSALILLGEAKNTGKVSKEPVELLRSVVGFIGIEIALAEGHKGGPMKLFSKSNGGKPSRDQEVGVDRLDLAMAGGNRIASRPEKGTVGEAKGR
jgi:hypothetical protein